MSKPVDETTLNPREAIAQFLAQQLRGIQLLRILASHDHWLVPASFAQGQPSFIYLRDGAGQLNLFTFTDTKAYDACRAKLGAQKLGEHYIETTGVGVWGSLADDVSIVSVNPNSEQEIHYKREQMPNLRYWAQVIKVERALANILTTDSGYDVIKAFDEYYIAFGKNEQGRYLLLAPDDKGRKLALLFTAEDAVDALLAARGQQGIEVVSYNGAPLFNMLKQWPLDGMVFNAYGPTKPLAFALAFAERVLQVAG